MCPPQLQLQPCDSGLVPYQDCYLSSLGPLVGPHDALIPLLLGGCKKTHPELHIIFLPAFGDGKPQRTETWKWMHEGVGILVRLVNPPSSHLHLLPSTQTWTIHFSIWLNLDWARLVLTNAKILTKSEERYHATAFLRFALVAWRARKGLIRPSSSIEVQVL